MLIVKTQSKNWNQQKKISRYNREIGRHVVAGWFRDIIICRDIQKTQIGRKKYV